MFERPQIAKKGLQKACGRPKPKSGQFNQQLTHIGKPASQRASQAHDRLVLYTLGLSGEAWEAGGSLRRIGECFGEAWGVLGNASGRIGEAGAQHTMPEPLFRHSMASHKR